MKETSSIFSCRHQCRRLTIFFWGGILLFGGIRAWESRHVVTGDGISYLDMATAFFRGNWDIALNSVWSPLYSWLLGLALYLLNPSPYWEFSVVQLVDFLLYVGALGSFHFLLTECIRYQHKQHADAPSLHEVVFPKWAWLALGYTLFLWSSQNMLTFSDATPDIGVAGIVFLASGLILRIRRNEASPTITFLLLGAILGLGYLTKAALFPLSAIFIGVTFFSINPFRKAFSKTLLVLLAFLLVSGPLLIVLSRAKGHLTFGETRMLNYVWFVNKITSHKPPYFSHWEGQDPGHGKPLHPAKKLIDSPPVFEFGSAVGGTYPLHYDPSYWYEGVKIQYSLPEQIRVLIKNAEKYVRIFFGFQSSFLIGCLILYLMQGRQAMRHILQQWHLLIPAIAAFGVYGLVLVEERYIAPFVVLLWLGLFSGIRLPDTIYSQKLLRSIVTAIVTIMLILCTLPVLKACLTLTDKQPHLQWQVSKRLLHLGIQRGDSVAFIGYADDFAWAHLAGVKIVAEIPPKYHNAFWAADPDTQDHIIKALRTTNATAIVSNEVPACAMENGWKRIVGTPYSAYLITPLNNEADIENAW